MIDNELIIFACQVLEYQPEPADQWTTVGQLETARRNHAVLSIGLETLPCLPGYLEQDDVFVKLQLSRLSSPLIFIIIILLVIMCHFYMANKVSLTNIDIDDHDHHIIRTTTTTKTTSTDQSAEAGISQTQTRRKVD